MICWERFSSGVVLTGRIVPPMPRLSMALALAPKNSRNVLCNLLAMRMHKPRFASLVQELFIFSHVWRATSRYNARLPIGTINCKRHAVMSRTLISASFTFAKTSTLANSAARSMRIRAFAAYDGHWSTHAKSSGTQRRHSCNSLLFDSATAEMASRTVSQAQLSARR